MAAPNRKCAKPEARWCPSRLLNDASIRYACAPAAVFTVPYR
jgi:hypothetical protein